MLGFCEPLRRNAMPTQKPDPAEPVDGQFPPVPDEDGPHDVPDDKVIEETLPSTPKPEKGGSTTATSAELVLCFGMKRFAAFLRGVSPMNCKMQELAKAFAAAGFTDVKTVLSSGNVVFTASGAERSIQKKAEAAMEDHMGKSFAAFVRPLTELHLCWRPIPTAHSSSVRAPNA